MKFAVKEIKHTKSGASCRIHEFGATVLSYTSAARREILFVSRDAKLDGSKAVRGGIPLVFPIFGPPKDESSTMPQHGFARNNVWSTVEGSEFDEDDSAGISYELDFNKVTAGKGTNNSWESGCYNVKLILDISITGDALTTILNIHNTGKEAFPFEALFHTYYSIDDHSAMDGSKCFVQGLEGYNAYDQLTKRNKMIGSEPITIDSELDSIHTPPDGIYIADLLIGVGATETIKLVCSGKVDGREVPVSVVVWNPHEKKAASMGDFGSDQYVDMLCVEPGLLRGDTLDAGKKATMKQIIAA
jgi:glucose-6-phosphate 1-epimerase